jgi:RND superfamily putative drug exporter
LRHYRETGRPGLFLRRNLVPDLRSRIGPILVRRPALFWFATVAVLAPFAVVGIQHSNQVNYDPLGELPESAPSAAGDRMLRRHFPPSTPGPVTVLLQNDRVDFASEKGIGLIRQLTERLEARKEALGIADLRSVAQPLGISAAAREFLAKLHLPPSLVESAVRERAVGHYVSHAGGLTGHVTRLGLVLALPPFSPQGINDLDRIETFLETDLPEGLKQGSQLSFCGPAATVRDLWAVTHADQSRLQALVPAVIFVLLLIVFRQAIVSLYLVLTVLFSYLATLGGTFLVFWLADPQGFSGLDWKVPLFLFTILVAVGEDYNIFLLSRVEEERRTRGPVQAVVMALARTGRVISTCGFIMAGSFACLFAGAFLTIKELGFALAVGVLLDTLVVRPVLVPTFWVLLHGRRRGTATEAPGPAGAAEKIAG